MTTFLEIIGVLALAVVLVIGGIYLYFRIKLGKYANVDQSKDQTPLIIHLNEEIEPEWVEKKEARAIEKSLTTLGFSADKCYEVVEMDGMQLRAFFNAPYSAVLYTHPIAGLWVDMVANTTDGLDYTVSNAPMGGEIEHAPYEKKYWLKGEDVTTLFETLKKEVGEAPIEVIASETFRDSFEDAYKKEMQWKSQKGGISFEEVEKMAHNDSPKYSDEEILETFRETKRKELMRWHDGAMEVYEKENPTPQNECYDRFDDLFIVPSKSDAVGFIRYLEDIYYLTSEQAKKFENKYQTEKNIEMPTLFKEINESFSKDLRATKKADVSYPIDIEIYETVKPKY
jgi:hypothetical protein